MRLPVGRTSGTCSGVGQCDGPALAEDLPRSSLDGRVDSHEGERVHCSIERRREGHVRQHELHEPPLAPLALAAAGQARTSGTRWPAAASFSAVARPKPRPPPVIRVVLIKMVLIARPS
jgi:hypothetical protein